MTKLVYILHDLKVGGVEVAFLSALPELRKRYDLKVIILGKIDPRIAENLSREERDCFEIFALPIYLLPVTILKVLSFVKKTAPDIVLCSLWRSSLMGVMIKHILPRVKLISFIHNTVFFHAFDKIFTSRAVKAADAIFVDASSTGLFIKKLLKPVAPVFDISFIVSPAPATFNYLPFEKRVRFIALGRIHKVKNYPLAVKFIAFLREQGLDAVLDIYGRNDGDLENVTAMIDQYKLAEFVKLKGEIAHDKKDQLFDPYHFFLQLSAFEGMAMSVTEAMQHGKVCIITPAGEIPFYSEDLRSAVFMEISEDKLINSFEKALAVISDENVYKAISKQCFDNFQHKALYKVSLIRSLNTVWEN